MVECSECKKFHDCLYGGELVGRLTSCPDFQQKPKTNADRIRAMSDEELAEFIRDVSYECQDAHWGCKCQSCDFPWCSSDSTLAWLQQPAEEMP